MTPSHDPSAEDVPRVRAGQHLARRILTCLLMLASAAGTAGPAPGADLAGDGTIDVDGTHLRYVVRGHGQPCLVIGSSIYYPRTFAPGLDRHLRMYFVDLRWFAKDYVPVPLDRYTLDTIVSDVDRIRAALRLDAVVLIGHSIHGTIALEYARRHPEHVSRLVLIGSPAILGSQDYEDGAAAIWKTASAERRALQDVNWARGRPSTPSPAGPVVDDYLAMAPKYWYDPHYDASWLWRDMSIQHELLRHVYDDLFARYRMFGATPSVPVPTLVVTGRYDYVIPHTQWQPYAALPGLTVRLFEQSGHTPQLEEPARFERELVAWLAQEPRRPGSDR